MITSGFRGWSAKFEVITALAKRQSELGVPTD